MVLSRRYVASSLSLSPLILSSSLFPPNTSHDDTKVRLVQDFDGKSRGYGFVEFEREKDMRSKCYAISSCCFFLRLSRTNSFESEIAAYKLADGKKIDGRRVLVDFERGRTQPTWRPRRLGLFVCFSSLSDRAFCLFDWNPKNLIAWVFALFRS